jgi:uncharacterized membrane protein (UPF0127 family)
LVENDGRIRQTVGVKRSTLFAALLAVGIATGCAKKDTAPPTPSPPVHSLPTEVQPKLQTLKIYLGAETLDAELALTSQQQETGMMFRTNVTDESAMLFVLPQPLIAPGGFWMTNCPVSLSAAYIGPDGVIEEIHHLEKNDSEPVVATNDNIIYVLEVNDGWFARHNIGPGTLIRTEKGSFPQTFYRNRQ